MSNFNENNEQRKLPNMRRNLTLDFNQGKKHLTIPTTSAILSSPDLNKLEVNTPELENMILTSGMTNTPTPSFFPKGGTPSFPFPKSSTAEQESFVGGFVEALSNLHHNNNSQQGSDSNASSTTTTNTTFNEPFLPQIKEEPQTVPNIQNTPPMSPVDMEYQERMKLERKRQRNRLAASKCRSRKLERISKLEEKVKLLKSENADLTSIVNQLKETVGLLKLEMIEHNQAGCQILY